MERMKTLGCTQQEVEYAKLNPDLTLGRIMAQHKNAYRVAIESGDLTAILSGKMHYEIKSSDDYPAVGDFVLLDHVDETQKSGRIRKILPRRSIFLRKTPGTAQSVQVIATNVDTVFLCMALNHDYNLRRMERYLSVAWDSGATPIILLTKGDLCDALEERILEVESIAPGVDVLVTYGLEEDGAIALSPYLKKGKTVAFIGSSGVGKSTLINLLLGNADLKTQGLRNDDKGRHTTTHRELFLMPEGGLLLDTPGMRELGIESMDRESAFADIARMAQHCRYSDCTHDQEPGCAVQEGILDGLLDTARLENYRKLSKEASYEGLDSRQIEKKKIEGMFKEFGGIKNAKKFLKNRSKR